MERKQIRNGGDKINLKRGVGSCVNWGFVFLNVMMIGILVK